MPRQVEDRREDGRREFPDFVRAMISFNAPDGSSHEYSLIELSIGGGAFVLPAKVPGLKAGTDCGGGFIRVGEIEIRINLQIRHVTRCEGNRYECGARIFPASDEDRNELISLLSRLGSVPA